MKRLFPCMPGHDGSGNSKPPGRTLWRRGFTVIDFLGHGDAVADEVKAWQSRPLEPVYPIVYLDCIHVKVRDVGVVRVKAIYLAIGINLQGDKEVLGLWFAQTEGAKFWLHVVTELKNRCVQDIFIASATAPALPYLLHPCSRVLPG